MDKSRIADESLFRGRRKRRSRAVWAREVKAFRDSGLSPEEYAAKRGLHIATLKKWVRILGDEVAASKGPKLPAFVPVSVVRATGSTEDQVHGKAFLVEVDLGDGRRVRAHVGSDVDMRRFAELVDTLDGGE
jgi:hypothetical protein